MPTHAGGVQRAPRSRPSIGRPVGVAVSPPAEEPPGAAWTFHPDDDVDHDVTPGHPLPPARVPGPGSGHPEGSRTSVVARAGIIVTALAVMTGALAVTHAGPFTSSKAAPTTTPSTTPPAAAPVDVRGTWNLLLAYEATFSAQSLVVTTENRTTGVFSGTVATPVGVESVTGKVSGTTLSFTVTLGSGRETGTATVVTRDGTHHMIGDFVSPAGVKGTITATLVSG